MTINGLHLLAALILIAALYLAAHWLEWRHADRIRRSDRMVQRNLAKISGRAS